MGRDDSWSQCRKAARLYMARRKQKDLSPQKQREVEAVTRALIWIREQRGERVQRFIILYHISQSHNLQGAADAVGYSKSRCKDFNREFIYQIARELGYM